MSLTQKTQFYIWLFGRVYRYHIALISCAPSNRCTPLYSAGLQARWYERVCSSAMKHQWWQLHHCLPASCVCLCFTPASYVPRPHPLRGRHIGFVLSIRLFVLPCICPSIRPSTRFQEEHEPKFNHTPQTYTLVGSNELIGIWRAWPRYLGHSDLINSGEPNGGTSCEAPLYFLWYQFITQIVCSTFACVHCACNRHYMVFLTCFILWVVFLDYNVDHFPCLQVLHARF